MQPDRPSSRVPYWIASVLLVIILPAEAALAFRSFVKAHPIIAALLWIIYELSLLSIGFFTEVSQKLRSRWVDRTVNAVDLYLRAFLSRYRPRYLETLIATHRNFDVKGLTTQGSHTLELEKVFVDLTLVSKPIHQASSELVRPMKMEEPEEPANDRAPIWDHLGSGYNAPRHFAILGPPGSGKTTLLKHVALTLARRKTSRSLHHRTSLPVLLYLRQYSHVIQANPDVDLAELIRRNLPRNLATTESAEWFNWLLERGRCIVMLDGLDEVASREDRKIVVAWVEKEIAAHPRNTFLITSRPFGYRDNPISTVSTLEIRSLTGIQVQRFIDNWYTETEIRRVGRDDAVVREEASAGARDLLARLRGAPALYALAVNPLLLTMIANVHRFRSSLPNRRIDLYAEICDVCLGKRYQARGMTDSLTPAQKQLVLRELAKQMMVSQSRDISVDAAVSTISQPLKRVAPEESPEQFLRAVADISGLLLEGELGLYRFAHMTFQEYLAATSIAERGQVDQLISKVDDPWWQETIRLYAAQSDATPIVQACIRGSSIEALALAVECSQEALEVEPSVRVELEGVLRQASKSEADAERSRMLREVELSLRLRGMTQLESIDSYLSPSLIAAGEYQLFLDDASMAGRAYEPDHCLNESELVKNSQSVALGVRASDAEAFCAWLDERGNGEWKYRIPGPKELSDPAVGMVIEKPNDVGYWVRDSNGVRLESMWDQAAWYLEPGLMSQDAMRGYWRSVPWRHDSEGVVPDIDAVTLPPEDRSFRVSSYHGQGRIFFPATERNRQDVDLAQAVLARIEPLLRENDERIFTYGPEIKDPYIQFIVDQSWVWPPLFSLARVMGLIIGDGNGELATRLRQTTMQEFRFGYSQPIEVPDIVVGLEVARMARQACLSKNYVNLDKVDQAAREINDGRLAHLGSLLRDTTRWSDEAEVLRWYTRAYILSQCAHEVASLGSVGKSSHNAAIYADLYAELALVAARRNGQAPPREGIVIVKEPAQKSETSAL